MSTPNRKGVMEVRSTRLTVLPLILLGVFSSLDSQILTTPISSSDWQVGPWSNVRIGRIGIAHESRGDVPRLHMLRDSVPTVFSTVIQSDTPPFSGNSFLVSHFDYKAVNGLGGVFNVFQREPSSAVAEYTIAPGGRRALSISYHKASEGFCGMWMHLFNTSTPAKSRVYFDANQFTALTFWIRGRKGGEQINLKIADATWLAKDDALPVGDVSAYLARHIIDTTWQVAVVPLAAFPPRINKRQLASLVFEAIGPENGQVMIKTLAFCVTRFPIPVMPSAAASRIPQRPLDKALWVWSTDKILGDKSKEDALLAFATQQRVNIFFLALPYEAAGFQSLMGITLRPDRFKPFIARCSAKGIKVHALIGDKNFILPEQRQFVTATVENVARYNADAQRPEQFQGIHLDVEAYLLPGFGGGRHGWIVENFLAMLDKAADAAHSNNLEVGADIPFWFDALDEFSEDLETFSFHGTTKPLHEHVIDLMDNVALMSYRTAAYGIDGIILHSSDEVEYATKTNKQAYVGLETGPLPDEDILTFRGAPQIGLAAERETAQQVYIVPRRDSADVYVVSPAQRASFDALLKSHGVNTSTVLRWAVTQSTLVTGDRISFAPYPPARLTAVMNAGAIELSLSKGFRGFAIHYYESYAKLLSKGGQ